MDKKIWITFIVFVVAVLSGTAYYKSNQEVSNATYTREDAIKDEVQRPKETINTKYQYKDGQHIFVGTLLLPTPCHSYNAEVDKRDNETEIKVTTASSEDMCIQQITERMFKVSFEGPEDELIIASLNGEVVNLNIFEVPEDEDIDDIEVFIKG
jgi:hypothetical protein